MTDDNPPDQRDPDPPRPLPPEVEQALDRAIASVPDTPMPAHLYGEPPPKSSRASRARNLRLGVAAAAAAAVVALVILLRDPGRVPTATDADTASPPPGAPVAPDTSPLPGATGAPSSTPGEVGTIEEQIERDRPIAAAEGLTLGLEVVAEGGDIDASAQPDLLAVVVDGVVVGYGWRDDVLAGDSYTVHDPDGQRAVGVMDPETGFEPAP